MAENESVAPEATKPRKVSVERIIKMLESGKDRKQISKELGLSWTQSKTVFAHAKLKGKKTRNSIDPNFTLVDTEAEEGEDYVAPTNITETATSEATVTAADQAQPRAKTETDSW